MQFIGNHLLKTLLDICQIVEKLFLSYGAIMLKKKKKIIDLEKQNYILEATHPSPLSCNRGGFFGCQNFIDCNKILEQLGHELINWDSLNH